VKFDFVQKAGAWYQYGEGKIGQGREAAKQYLTDHQDILKKLDRESRAAVKAGA
jgi:recombination protein RecA